jgi:lysophospholipase L1-like esterase
MKILVFGDSITYGVSDEKGGWANRLRRELEKEDIAGSRHVTNGVYNCGVRGDTTEDLLQRFDLECSSRAERQDNPIILFAIGTNDSAAEGGSTLVPLPKYTQNLKILLEKAKVKADNVVFVGLFPVDETKTVPIGWRTERSYTNKSIEEYNSAIKSFCKENGIGFIDLFKQFHKQAHQELLSDGLHPNSKGHQKIYKTVQKGLRKAGYL